MALEAHAQILFFSVLVMNCEQANHTAVHAANEVRVGRESLRTIPARSAVKPNTETDGSNQRGHDGDGMSFISSGIQICCFKWCVF